MFKAQLWINNEWSLPFRIISINIVPKIFNKPNSVWGTIKQVNQYHIIYCDENDELDTVIYNRLSDIKLIH